MLPLLPRDRQELFVIGGGSNVLFSGDYPGTVLHSAIRGIKVTETGSEVVLTAGSGEVMDDVIRYAVEHHLYGMENLSLIPGEVGASAVQNIGAYGAEAKDFIREVRAFDLDDCSFKTIAAADCLFGYRSSRFKTDWAGRMIITAVSYALSRTFTPRLDYGNIRAVLASDGISEPTAQQLRDAVCKIRREKLPDPAVTGNAGSFFKNPLVDASIFERLKASYPDMPHYTADGGKVKIPAAWLIEQSGWKGRRLGRAAVHDRQALVLINAGGASPQDVLKLCQAVQEAVDEKFGIRLQREVVLVGAGSLRELNLPSTIR